MNDIVKVICIFVLIALAIMFYGNYRCNNPDYRDPLMKKLGVWDLDGWSITHFVSYFCITYFFPDKWMLIAMMGLLWEGFEAFAGKSRPGWLGGFGDCATTDPNIENWWFGRLSDIFVNVAGIMLAVYLKA